MNSTNQFQSEEKWYDKTWLAILLLILFFPVGFYALYKSKKRSPVVKGVVTVLFCILFVVAIMKPNKNGGTTSVSTSKSAYEKNVNDTLSQLTPERKAERDKILAELRQLSVYKQLVDSQIVSQRYLIVLEGIGNVLATSNPENFSIDEEIGKNLEADKDKLDFVVKLGTLVNRGGLPKEIEDVFKRYVKFYKMSGSKGDIIINASTQSQETITEDFTLSQAMVIFEPKNNEALDAYFEAIQNGLLSWNTNLPNDAFYPYMNDPDLFNEHLRNYHPKSKYFMDYDIRTTPVKLSMEYQENEVSADNKYKGKKVMLEGTVIDISKDILNDAFIILNTGNEINRIQCYSLDENALSKLSRGSQVKLVGKCTGKILFNVLLKDCNVFLK